MLMKSCMAIASAANTWRAPNTSSSDQPGAPQTSKYGVGRSGQSKDPKGEGEAEKRKNKTKTPARGLVKVRGVSGGMQLARSGDWSDSLSEDSDPELKALDKSSSGSDDGSAVPLDETLTLDKLHQSAATAPPDAAGTLGRVMAATEVGWSVGVLHMGWVGWGMGQREGWNGEGGVVRYVSCVRVLWDAACAYPNA